MSRILQRIEAVAKAKPDAIALRSGETCLSYRELIDDVHAISARLRALRTRSLGIYLDNGIEWIVFDLAALAAGIRIVPLPWFFSNAQIRHAIDAGAVDLVAFERQLPQGIAASGAPIRGYRGACLQPMAGAGAASVEKRGGAKLSFTSGSTGSPKGIELEAAFLERTCDAVCVAVARDAIDVHLAILPYATLLENVAGVYVPLVLGKTVVAEAAETLGLSPDLRLEPARLARVFERVRPASLILTPQLLELVCMLCERGAINPDCLEFVAVGGARVGEFLLQRARTAGIPAYEGYGLTEFGSVAMLNTPTANRIGSVGKPLPGVRVRLGADAEILLETDIEETIDGRCRQRTVRVASGDYGDIDADGFVYVHGRKSNLIVLANGRNVSPEWVETELTAAPSIRQAFVFDGGDSQLSALLFADSGIDGDDLDAELLRINRDLPPYARVRRWHRMRQPFSRDNGTLTANGRLRRPQILQMLAALCADSATRSQPTNRGLSQPSPQENYSWN